MKLCFDSIEEVKEFVVSLKGTRGKKGEADDAPAAPTTAVPAPMAPPATATQFAPPMTGFAPQAAPAAPPAAAFPAAVAPEITALVQRIVAKLDAAIASGQPADAALTWLRGQCGPETANYTLDQIKQHGLPKLAQPALENIAKLMAA